MVLVAEGEAGVIQELASALSRGRCRVRDEAIFDDLVVFKHDGKGGVEHPREKSTADPAAAREAHADAGIACALTWKLAEEMGTGTLSEPLEDEPSPITLAGRIAMAEAESGDRLEEQWY